MTALKTYSVCNPMKPLQLIFTLLLLSAINVAAAEWTQVTKTYQSIGYADFSSIEKNGSIILMNILIDYEKAPFDGNNLAYLSLKISAEYNCITQQFRTLKLASYTGKMASGRQPYLSDEASGWKSVAGSIQQAFWKTACKK